MVRFVQLVLTLLLAAGIGMVPSPGAFQMKGLPALQQPKMEVNEAHFEQGNTWAIASTITLTVAFKSQVLLASWQWADANGQPIIWMGAPLPPLDMKPLPGGGNVWTGRGAAPPLPANYKVRLTARPAGSQAGTAAPEQTTILSLTGQATTDSQPFTRGFVSVRDRNLWLHSLDFKRERAVTFYGYPALASMPAWSPDGRWIAYILDPGTSGSTTELWVIRPDGTGARRITSGDSARALGYPLFTLDGTLLVSRVRELVSGDVPLGETWDLFRVDMVTGKLTLLQSSIYMPAISPFDGRMVFIRDTPTSDDTVEHALVVSDLDGANEQTLTGPGQMDGLSAPAWSPDGKRIVFASRAKLSGADIGKAGLAAPAFHGGVWDLYTVPASGGVPTLLSTVQEDLPYPQWPPDGSRVYFVSPTGFWGVPASGGPPQWLAGNDLHSELSVFAPQPRTAQPLDGPSKCFTEPNQCLHGIFLQYWNSHGGLAQFGLPTGPELTEEGMTVQYLERARFEWHTENKGTPYEVLVGRLGADLADPRNALGEKPFQKMPKPADTSMKYFPETGHTLAAPMRAYWEANGGLPVFGYPLSEAFNEKSPTDGKTYLVQYFERNRLEYHPENKGTPYEVLLGLLGVQEYARRYK